MVCHNPLIFDFFRAFPGYFGNARCRRAVGEFPLSVRDCAV
jgi:hypothetical protein